MACNQSARPPTVPLAGAPGWRRCRGRLSESGGYLSTARCLSNRNGSLRRAANLDFVAGPDGLLASRAVLPGTYLDDEYSRRYGRRRHLMLEGLQQLFESSPLEASATLALYFLLYVLLGLLPVCGAIYLVYFLLTLPLRRNQRARSFLDLVDPGLKEGRTPEATIIDASASHDRSLGVRFHLLAVHLESGMRLSVALERVPRLLPPQIIAMLKTGERIGDVAKVLPACRQALKGGVSQVRGAINYIILLAFVLTPFSLFVPIFLRIKIIPAYRDVFQGLLEGAALPAFTRFILGEYSVFAIIQIAIVAFVWLAMLAYVGGPRLRAWIGSALPGMPDAVLSRLPWRQKRLERDFSAMLAVLLDAQVPETEAVSLAAESTANMTVARRAEKVRALLKDGVKL